MSVGTGPTDTHYYPHMKRTLTVIALLWTACTGGRAQEPELHLERLPAAVPTPTETAAPDDASTDTPVRQRKPKREHRWQFGINAGYLHSTADWLVVAGGVEHNDRDRIRSHPGLTAGFSASCPFGEVWTFDTGVNFSWWGAGYRSSSVSMRTERYTVDIPVLLTFFERDAYIPVFLQAGLLTGIVAGGTIRVNGSNEAGEWTPRRAGDSFNRLSLGLVLGIGYGHFTFQFIQNFTGTWNRDMLHAWEAFTGNTLSRQRARGYSLTYTHWF